ncbi:hypothetical protein ACWOFR_06430 [Carnobacterium gallinarum]|uniref:hypothetical protein n=1 Tax=Carnobacterium gallinarum TaxID=2749 RepID=UPI0005566695|nr:hypothetical protein [Carnobacterium gallinarum]
MYNQLTKFLETKDSEIITDSFVITGNVLKFTNITIQLSNISQIYAGKRKFQIPYIAIIVFLISLMLLRVQFIIGLIGCALSGLYIYSLYQKHNDTKVYLSFSLNSGKHYLISFNNQQFLNEVRAIVEASFNKQKGDYKINIAEQKIIHGDHHTVKGDLNYEIQEDHSINSHNTDSFNDDHSTTLGNLTNSNVQLGNNNAAIQTTTTNYDWKAIEAELSQVISALKIDSPVKKASEEALIAAREENITLFETIIKKYRNEFCSELFQNIVSGVLAQVILNILKIG